ncbi:MAG: arylesterase [Thermodesulfobacteriota bacterium]
MTRQYNRFAFFLLLFLGIIVGCQKTDAPEAPAAPADSTTAQPPTVTDSTATEGAAEGTIVAVGDSLTEGFGLPEGEAYPAVLEARLREAGYDFQVVNAGISGETSSGAKSRAEWVLKLEPDIVILGTGANDGLRGVDPAVTRKNIAETVEIFQNRGVVVILTGLQMVRNMGEEFTREFAAVYPDVAREKEAILVPFFLEGVAMESSLNQDDGIHPNAEGYRRIVDGLFPYVVQAIEKWRAG